MQLSQALNPLNLNVSTDEVASGCADAHPPLRVLDLFSGIGGFSLGLERTGGFETVAFCEIEEFPRRVLAKHWPTVPCYTDVRDLTAERLAADGISVDVICGGFPCQDISLAGKGAGIEGERSGLWSEYSRLIGELRPRYVVVENVAALLNRGLDRVLGDMAALGYDAEWHVLGAAHVGADHIRERLWICAYPQSLGRDGWGGQGPRSPLLEVGGLVPKPDRAWPDAASGFGALYGLPHRLDRLRSLGNAVVPQIPELIGNAILSVHRSPAFTLPGVGTGLSADLALPGGVSGRVSAKTKNVRAPHDGESRMRVGQCVDGEMTS